mmetsp:Transcript_3008/g.4400  ORF Transcript_3008/g.4400 Transcript_3008/m.4400 type:complete len:220 (+) Transcript_3008:394-1053(+)
MGLPNWVVNETSHRHPNKVTTTTNTAKTKKKNRRLTLLDHSVAQLTSDSLLAGDATTEQIAKQLGQDFHNVGILQYPVWFDHIHHSTTMSPERLLVTIGCNNVGTYAPAISSAGIASIILTACWLLSGYVTEAFMFRHTIECSPTKALEVTGKTWMLTTILMVSLALGSDYVWGNIDSLHNPSHGGLTRADADFIFDTLPVLVSWRYIISWLLGYGNSK